MKRELALELTQQLQKHWVGARMWHAWLVWTSDVFKHVQGGKNLVGCGLVGQLLPGEPPSLLAVITDYARYERTYNLAIPRTTFERLDIQTPWVSWRPHFGDKLQLLRPQYIVAFYRHKDSSGRFYWDCQPGNTHGGARANAGRPAGRRTYYQRVVQKQSGGSRLGAGRRPGT